MMTPVQAMLWQIWKGWRWGLILGWAYMILAAIVVRVLPDITLQTQFGVLDLQRAGGYLAAPCEFIVIHLMAVFSLVGTNDISKTGLSGTGFSAKMFVLPMRTQTLVIWPMIWGCCTVACVWLFIAGVILRPTGTIVPMWWPAAALAVCLTMLQALSWVPLAQSWPRIFIAVPIFMTLVVAILFVVIIEVPEPIATVGFLGLLPLTYLASLHGVALARRGDAYDWSIFNRLLAWATAFRKPIERPFSSAARAQLWFECRRFGWMLPVFMASILPFFMVVVLVQDRSELAGSWRLLATILLMPALMGSLLGCQFGDVTFPFLATRPIPTAVLVRSKFKMALVSAVASYILVLLFLPLFLLRPGFFDSFLQATRAAGPMKGTMIIVIAPVLLLAITWKGLVEHQWIGLTGRKWLMDFFGVGIAVLMGLGVFFGLWVWLNPDVQALLWTLAPWFVGCLLIAKLLVALSVVLALLRTRLVEPTTAVKMIVVWSTIIVVLVLTAVWLIPSQYRSMSGVFAAVVLFVPFSRIVGAPLTLDWNRHR